MSPPTRTLSPEDHALWALVTAGATPLAAARPEPVPAAEPPSLSVLPPAARPAQGRHPARVASARGPEPAATLDRAHPHMDRRRFEQLRRGRIAPQARLDLHGLTAGVAHAALSAFILDAHAAGLRLVLVITGKGAGDGEEWQQPQRRGILRHSVPHWLGTPPLASRVLQVTPAHPRHGGAGAFYVYLRRQR